MRKENRIVAYLANILSGIKLKSPFIYLTFFGGRALSLVARQPSIGKRTLILSTDNSYSVS